MTPTSQFTQAPPIAGPRPPGLSGGRPFRVAILAVAASLLTVAPAPSWGQKGSDLRDDIEFDVPRVSREPPDLIEAIIDGLFYKDERWDLSPGESDATPPEANAGSGQQRRTDPPASPLTVARTPSPGEQGSDPRDDIDFDLPRVSREPRDRDAELWGDYFFYGRYVAPKDERWGLVPGESDAPPPGANAGSGQQRRTTSVPNLLDPFRIVGRGGEQSQRTGAASASPSGFDVSRNFNPPDRFGGSARQRSPVNSANTIPRGPNTLGGADRRPRN